MAKQISKEQQEILSQIVPIIAEKLGIDQTLVTMEANFENDLGADSLDRVELFMEFDKKYNLNVPDDQQKTIETVGDVVRLIEKMSDDPKYRKTPEVVKPSTNEKKPDPQKTQSAPKVVNSKETVEKPAGVKTPQNVSGDPLKTTVGELLEMPVEQALNLFNQIRAQMTLRAKTEKKK